ncbi:helix-turn-helix domain-containing protein [Loktanella sp. F6476L]|uniref:helix-turn-helix domain-containing protein n=1 Tax=Loktanella sp. F6476L TaxID=2926405 RepID=UPI001FF67B33|nr:helix-turn-helix domain-containing protein [Loktanella sp. F6476L]MCK0118902.1 helix-turn-helix domain-containing protein [Loktanella sp. F6476L]
MKTIDIAELSQQTGLPASTLRYYEEKSLISAIGRRGLRRLFDASVFQRLALVALGRSAGFSLSEISAFLLSDHKSPIDRDALRAKADEVDRQIHTLQQVREGLLHVAQCPEPSHLKCPRFQRMMRIAAKKQARAVNR